MPHDPHAREDAMLAKALAINTELIKVRPRMDVYYQGAGIGGRYALVVRGLSEAKLRRLIEVVKADHEGGGT